MCIKGKLVFYIGGGISNDRTRSIGSGGGSGESLNKGMMNVSRYGESTVNNNKDYPNKYKKYIFKEGDWECPHQSCKNINFSRRTKCNKCGAPKPQNAYHSNSSSYSHSGNSGRFGGISSRYRSGNSNYHSTSHSRSRSRSRSRSSRSSRSRSLTKKHHYQSKYTRSHSRSSHSRDRERTHEHSYQQQQPQKKSYFGGPPGLFKEGDWRCENCQNINFKWRVICNKCQYSKRDHQNIDYKRSSSYYEESRGSSNRYYQNVSSSHKGGYNGYYRNESGNNNGNSNAGAMNLNMRSRGGYGDGYGSNYGYVYSYGKERELNRNDSSDNAEKHHDKSSSSSSSSRKKSSSSSSSSSRKSSSSSSGSKTPHSDSSSKSDGSQ